VAPDAIGHYLILEPLGSGGMGTVYRARHATLSSRIVAIKVLSDAVVGKPAIRERFLREAEIMSALHHENIVMLHDFLIVDGVYAIVMERVEGVTLDRFVGEGPVPFARAAPLLRQLLAALGHAHAHGVVHRDVKPSNVLVTHDGVVKVTDFGIARLADDATLTLTGVGMGTPRYMSPEQVQGRREITPASDIYSCGVLVHRLLAGSLPFDAPDAETFSILQAHVSAPPPRLGALVPGMDPSIEAAVLCALAKDPAERWPSCESFALALGLGSAGAAAPAPPRASDETRSADQETRYTVQAQSGPGRRRTAVWLSALGTTALLAAGGVGLWASRNPGGLGAAPPRPVPEAASESPASTPRSEPSPAAAPLAEPAAAAAPPAVVQPALPSSSASAPSQTTQATGPAPPPSAPPSPVVAPALIKAEALLEGGAPAKALEALKPLLESEPANREAQALEQRVRAALDAESAQRRKLAAAKRADAQKLYDKGKFDLAIERWTESLDLEPGSPDARRGIERAKREKTTLWREAQGGTPVLKKEGNTP
jgi:serine/threonine-protein kinase